MADAQHINDAVKAEERRGSAPFALVLLVALTAGIVGGLLLCDVVTRPDEPSVVQQATLR